MSSGQSRVKLGQDVIFLPTTTETNPCIGKFPTVEKHHQCVDQVFLGDNVGLNIKVLDKNSMPRSGGVVVLHKGAPPWDRQGPQRAD